MSNEIIKALVPTRAEYNVIGTLMQKLDYARDEEYFLTTSDFAEEYKKIIYVAIDQIAQSDYDLKEISPVDVDNFIAKYPENYKKYKDNGGFDFLCNCWDTCNSDMFDANYTELRKFSLLRHYEEHGISTKNIYDYDNLDIKERTKQRKELDKLSEEDIKKQMTLMLTNANDSWKFGGAEESTFYKAGMEGDDDEEVDEIGISFASAFYNEVFLGASRGRFLLISADTGGGKTRNMIAHCCNFSCAEIFDLQLNKWVPLGFNKPTVFMCTELDKKELKALQRAYLTGIPVNELSKGNLSPEKKRRVEYADKVLREAPLYIDCIGDDFDVADITMRMHKYVMDYNAEYIAFDYIEVNPKLTRYYMKQYSGLQLREDQILIYFSKALKKIAKMLDVFVMSGTQLNGKDVEMDAKKLSGGKSTANKVDHGVILSWMRAQDLENKQFKKLLKNYADNIPNYAHWIYKNRKGQSRVVLWTKMNLGNMREEFIFATDYNYNPIKIKPLPIAPEDEGKAPEESQPYETMNVEDMNPWDFCDDDF